MAFPVIRSEADSERDAEGREFPERQIPSWTKVIDEWQMQGRNGQVLLVTVKILLIDDHALLQGGAQVPPAQSGCRARGARSGHCAKRSSTLRLNYGTCLLDLNMPGVAGLDALAGRSRSASRSPLVVPLRRGKSREWWRPRSARRHGFHSQVLRRARSALHACGLSSRAACISADAYSDAAGPVPFQHASGANHGSSRAARFGARQMTSCASSSRGNRTRSSRASWIFPRARSSRIFPRCSTPLGTRNRTEAVYAAAKLGPCGWSETIRVTPWAPYQRPSTASMVFHQLCRPTPGLCRSGSPLACASRRPLRRGVPAHQQRRHLSRRARRRRTVSIPLSCRRKRKSATIRSSSRARSSSRLSASA